MKKTLLIAAVVVLVLGAIGVGVAFAQGGNPPSTPNSPFGYGRGMMGGGNGMMGTGNYGAVRDYVEKALASKLGLTEAQVEQELASKPMYQIALDHGIAQAGLQNFMADVHKTAFAAAVADGVMTQAQADAMLARVAQNGYGVNCPMGGGGYGNGHGNGRGMMGGGRWQNQNP